MKIHKKPNIIFFSVFFLSIFLIKVGGVAAVTSCGGADSVVCSPGYSPNSDVYSCPSGKGNMDGWACGCAPSASCDSGCSNCSKCCDGQSNCNVNKLSFHSAICTDGHGNFDCTNQPPPVDQPAQCGESCVTLNCSSGLSCDSATKKCISPSCESNAQTNCVCSTPTPTCSASFSPNTITVPGSPTLTWSTSNANGLYFECDGPIDLSYRAAGGLNGSTSFPFSSSGGEEVCTFTPFNGATAGATCRATVYVDVDVRECIGSIPVGSTMCRNDDINLLRSLEWSNVGSSESDCSLRKCQYYTPTSTPTCYPDNSCQANTCEGGSCWNLCAWVPGTKNCPTPGPTTPSASASFSPVNITAPGTSYLSWSSSNADKVLASCSGPLPVAWGDYGLSYDSFPFPFTSSQTGTETCSFIPYNGLVAGNITVASVTIGSGFSPASWSPTLSANPPSGSPPLTSTLTTGINAVFGGENYIYSNQSCGVGGSAPTNISGEKFTCTYSSAGTYTPSITVTAQSTGVSNMASATVNVSASACTPSVGSWSSCSVACGTGTQTRSYTRADCTTGTETQNCSMPIPECLHDTDAVCEGLCGKQSNTPGCYEGCASDPRCPSDSWCSETTDCGPCNSGTWKEVAP